MNAKKNIRVRDGALEVEFLPGQWAQVLAPFRTTWTWPDAEGKNNALKQAADGLLEEMVMAYNERAALIAIYEAAVNLRNARSTASDDAMTVLEGRLDAAVSASTFVRARSEVTK